MLIQLLYKFYTLAPGNRPGEFRTINSLSCFDPRIKDCSVHEMVVPSWLVRTAKDELEQLLLAHVATFYVNAENHGDNVIYTLFFIDDWERINTVLIVQEAVDRFVLTYEAAEYICDTLLSLLKKLPFLKYVSDPRPYVQIAVSDRENARVQLLKFYWTTSDIFKPQIVPLQQIGGSKKRFCTLLAPISVSYSPTGELAVCDAGDNHCVTIFSTTLTVIKRIFIGFIMSGVKEKKSSNNKVDTKDPQYAADVVVEKNSYHLTEAGSKKPHITY